VATGEARQVVPFSGPVSELQAFVTAEKLPLTMEFSQGNADKIFNSGIDRQVSLKNVLWLLGLLLLSLMIDG
jgi:hypothetical protein